MSRSTRFLLRSQKKRLLLLRPRTILVTPLARAYSAIWRGVSSPYTVAMRAPSSSARRRLARRRLRLSSLMSLKSEVSTNRAVKLLRKASAMRAAVRMTLALDGAPDRQTRMCSLLLALVPTPVSAARLSRSAVRRRAISRRAARFFRVKKWSMARAAWLGR